MEQEREPEQERAVILLLVWSAILLSRSGNGAAGQQPRRCGTEGGREARASSDGVPWRREGGAATEGGAAAAEKWRWRRERSGEGREGERGPAAKQRRREDREGED